MDTVTDPPHPEDGSPVESEGSPATGGAPAQPRDDRASTEPSAPLPLPQSRARSKLPLPRPPFVPPPVPKDATSPATAPAPEDKTSPGMLAAPRRPRKKNRPGTDSYGVIGVRSPLVGRTQQLEEMAEVIRRAVDFQTPQLITVLGNQGTGKSRLVDELVARHAGADTRVFWGRAMKGGARYGAISRFLRARFKIADGEPEEQAIAKFTAEVKQVFGDDRVAEVLHFLGDFLDLRFPDSPFVRMLEDNPAQQEEISRTVIRRFIELDAEHSPLIVVFDDLQWADGDTLDLLYDLGASLGGSPVVLIALARPEMMARFSDWGGGSTDHIRIDLRNLDVDDAETMCRALLSRCESVPEEIVEDAVEMTGGNPYFLEQLVRLFLANGTIDSSGQTWRIDADRAAETELPISIEEAIEARIAALDTDERGLLEQGAVFGNVFWAGAIVALTRMENARKRAGTAPPDGEDADDTPAPTPPLELDWSAKSEPVKRRITELIDALVERDYLLRLDEEDSTIAGDVELVFKHNLERELVAKSTEVKRLERYHRLAAQWFETKLLARSEEQLEFLAQLYERGGDGVRAAHCYLTGADRAKARYANGQAVQLYKRGLSMLQDHDSVAWLDALHNYGSVLDLIGETEQAEQKFVEMLDRAWLIDHKSKGGAAHGRIGRIARRRGDYDRSMAHLRAAHDLFTRAGDQRGVAGTMDDIGKVHWLRGAYGQALEFHRQALAIRRGLGDRRSIALSLANIGRVHNDSGAFKAANRQFREALDLRRDIGDLSGVVQSLCDLGGVHIADGNLEMALELFTEAHHIATDIGEKMAQTEVLSRLGECKAQMGRGPEGVENLLEAVSIATQLGNKVALSECHRRLSGVHLTMGDARQAHDCGQRALEIAEKIGSRVHIGNAHRVLGEAVSSMSLAPPQVEQAEEHFRRAVDILAGMKNELALAGCYRSYAMFKEMTGQQDDAGRLRKRSDEIFGRLRGAASTN